MLSSQLRQRLKSRLHREPLPANRAAPPPTAVGIGERVELAVGHETANAGGRHWWIEKPLPRIWPAATQVLSTWKDAPPPHEPDDQKRQLRAEIERTVFLDLETCGFAGSMIFLVGLLYYGARGPVLLQLWARNYAEEPAVLESLRQILAGRQLLATFNGKSFDWPQVRDRYTLHARSAHHELPELTHIDLLHHARRRWKTELPDCKLQTLERFICGRHRVGDIPGSRIPDAYHSYVQTGDTTAVRSILHHNALDLVTLLQLSLVLTRDPG